MSDLSNGEIQDLQVISKLANLLQQTAAGHRIARFTVLLAITAGTSKLANFRNRWMMLVWLRAWKVAAR
jgi:hypothetical protein